MRCMSSATARTQLPPQAPVTAASALRGRDGGAGLQAGRRGRCPVPGAQRFAAPRAGVRAARGQGGGGRARARLLAGSGTGWAGGRWPSRRVPGQAGPRASPLPRSLTSGAGGHLPCSWEGSPRQPLLLHGRGVLGASGHWKSPLSPVRRASSVWPALRALGGQRGSIAPRPGGAPPPGVSRQRVLILQTLATEAT